MGIGKKTKIFAQLILEDCQVCVEIVDLSCANKSPKNTLEFQLEKDDFNGRKMRFSSGILQENSGGKIFI